jgi:hypothetical protein
MKRSSSSSSSSFSSSLSLNVNKKQKVCPRAFVNAYTNSDNTDAIIVTKCGEEFHVSKYVLGMVSSVFRSAFGCKKGNMVLTIDYSKKAVNTFLLTIHPTHMGITSRINESMLDDIMIMYLQFDVKRALFDCDAIVQRLRSFSPKVIRTIINTPSFAHLIPYVKRYIVSLAHTDPIWELIPKKMILKMLLVSTKWCNSVRARGACCTRNPTLNTGHVTPK